MKVAEAISDGFAGQRQRIRRLIFFNAFVLNDGESLRNNVPPHLQTLLDELVRESNDRMMIIPFEMWREAFLTPL
ncbi:hypothetical protein [Scytonema sp. UIC 10036]|uniref:hypothetical protein n=1 Tax=Scytonema sp. UIC 10036 TaxID=2304196 RepID=UPI001FAAA8F0|nr:hypothetical protein [Scytonema sp. UIC 10036]